MPQASTDFDVAVIGAGAAGLCAAAELCRQGRTVLLLEARERVGGRVLTHYEPSLAHPLELGAEFVHGEAPLTMQLLRSAGVAAIDTAGERFSRNDDGVHRRRSEFDQVQQLLAQAGSLPRDLSVAEFLERYAAGEARGALRGFVRRMVEGFDAADPHEASVQAIAREWHGASMGGQHRPLGGYGPVLAALLRALDPARTRLMLGTAAEVIDWGGERVSIQARGAAGDLQLHARRAVVSVPVSLLQTQRPGHPPCPEHGSSLRFVPALTDKQAALERLALGAVIKVLLQFRRPFWERLAQCRYADAGFLHASQAPFPTLWTALPFRVPLLTAWMGGPRALRLAGAPRAQLIELALQSVTQVFELGNEAADELLAAYVHDWSADPHARGAYCYLRVGGSGAPAALARPLAARLFFAGEATHEDYTGTVEAALQSGRSAAQALLAADQ